MTPFDNNTPAARPRSPYSGLLLLGVTLVMVIACAFSLLASQRLQSLMLGAPPAPPPTASPTVPLASLPPLDLGRSTLSSVAMLSSTDGWIVGENSGYSLILRYQGGRWLPQPVTVAASSLHAVAFADTQHGWAVGFHRLDHQPATTATPDPNLVFEPLVLRYEQGHWFRVMPSIAIQGGLTKIHLVSPDDWWALNNRGEASNFALVHYRHGVWSTLPLPADLTDVHGLWVAGPNDVWLGTIGGVVHVHDNIVERPLQGMSGNLLALAQPATQDMWAVGFAFCGAEPSTPNVCDQRVAVYHYNGAAWTPSATDARGMLEAVAAVSADDVWAVGSAMSKSGPTSLILRYHDGAWRQTATTFPVDLTTLSMTTTADGWAVGYAQLAGGTGNAPGLLHYHAGVWTQVTLA